MLHSLGTLRVMMDLVEARQRPNLLRCLISQGITVLPISLNEIYYLAATGALPKERALAPGTYVLQLKSFQPEDLQPVLSWSPYPATDLPDEALGVLRGCARQEAKERARRYNRSLEERVRLHSTNLLEADSDDVWYETGPGDDSAFNEEAEYHRILALLLEEFVDFFAEHMQTQLCILPECGCFL